MGLEEGDGVATCRLVARACAAAAAVDAAVPRPGLTSLTRPLPDPDPLAVAAAAGPAYEACLCSCLHGLGASSGWAPGCWLPAVIESSRPWGNAWMGALFLQSLQAAATGAAARHGRQWSDEAVMGASRAVLEAEGVEGAAAFYEALAAAAPGYLARLSWSGLPDASRSDSAAAAREMGLSLAELADAASLYDLVMRDASRLMELSIGTALPLIEEEARRSSLAEAVKKATIAIAAEGDMLLHRRARIDPQELRLAQESPVAEAMLWRRLRRKGPGAAADVVAAALTRLVAKRLAGAPGA